MGYELLPKVGTVWKGGLKVGCGGWNCSVGVRYEFGILFSFHSFECPFLFRTLISSVASIFPMKVTEQFLRALRRSAASASSFSAAPVGPAPLMVFFGAVVVLLLRRLCGWWDYVRIEFFWLIHILRRFNREYVLILLIGVCLIVLLPAQLLPH